MIIMQNDELVSTISESTGYYKKEIDAILKCYYKVVQLSLMNGIKIRVPNVGFYSVEEVDPKPEREQFIPYHKKKVTLPAQEGYNRPVFRFSEGLAKKMKQETLGNTI